MSKLAESNVEYRRALGDALMTNGMIEAQFCFIEANKWNEGQSHETQKATDRAVAAFANAQSHFQVMMDDGMGSDAIQNQIDNCKEVTETLESQVTKLKQAESDDL